jgi:hypothetical protein
MPAMSEEINYDGVVKAIRNFRFFRKHHTGCLLPLSETLIPKSYSSKLRYRNFIILYIGYKLACC